MTASLMWRIAKHTVSEFMEDNVPRLAAALAYYAMFSIGPLLIIVIAVAGLAFDKGAVHHEVAQQLQSLVGRQGAQTIESMLSTQRHNSNLIATVVGIVVLIFGASGVFGQLQDALNTIWEVKPKSGQGIWGFIRNRFLSFAMVLGTGFLLLISMVITTALEAATSSLNHFLTVPGFAAKGLHFMVSFLVISSLFGMIFKILPDAQVKWRDVWVGAVGTSLLFTIGKFLMSMYLGRESTASPYGAAGSVILVLLWIYYSSIILFFGSEFTQVYARETGSRIVPSANAESVTEKDRAEQGIPHDEKRAVEPVLEPEWDDPTVRTPAAPALSHVSLASVLGLGFVTGWLAHRKMNKRRSTP